MAARGKILEPHSLIEIQQTLAAIRQLRNSLGKLSKEIPLIDEEIDKQTLIIDEAIVEIQKIELEKLEVE